MIRIQTESRTRLVLLAAALYVALVFPALALGLTQGPAAGPTLYQRLGGYDGVVSYIALVFPRVAAHPDLSHLFRGHGKDSQKRQFQLVIELICQRTGGPCAYIGREMPPVHSGLGVTEANWKTFLEIIEEGLLEKGYPAEVREEFLEIWRGFHDSVVEIQEK